MTTNNSTNVNPREDVFGILATDAWYRFWAANERKKRHPATVPRTPRSAFGVDKADDS